MPQDKDLKRLVWARMAQTGERYTQALTHVLSLTKTAAGGSRRPSTSA
jgi:hypothetical protein